MPSVSPGRILVVDDNDGSRFARVRWLRAVGHTVFEAARLAEADILLREMRPELLVLDVHLPDGNGIDYCRQIKQAP
jgi:two-component system NtrC family sensor kinase